MSRDAVGEIENLKYLGFFEKKNIVFDEDMQHR